MRTLLNAILSGNLDEAMDSLNVEIASKLNEGISRVKLAEASKIAGKIIAKKMDEAETGAPLYTNSEGGTTVQVVPRNNITGKRRFTIYRNGQYVGTEHDYEAAKQKADRASGG